MAQQYIADNGQVLTIPGTYVETKVQTDQTGIATSGVVTLIGEADEGPHWSEEPDLDRSAFTPDQLAPVIQKYGSGRLVDAFRSIVAAANDPAIVGSVSLVRLVKTNLSTKAQATHARSGFGNYNKYLARRAGISGNSLRYQHLIAQAESDPTTGAFTYAPALTGSINIKLRNNGGVPKNISIPAKQPPTTLKNNIHDVTLGLLATGGIEKLVIPASGLSISAAAPNANTLIVTLQTGSLWSNNPQVGDTAVIPLAGDYSASANSVIAGPSDENIASYVVTAVTNTLTSATLTLRRISSGSTAAASGTTASDLRDIILYSPIIIRNATGQDRGSLVGVDGTYNCVSNDGVNVVLNLPSGKVFAAMPRIGDWAKFHVTFAGINPGIYQVVGGDSDTVELVRLSDGSAGTTGSENVTTPPTMATQPFRIEKRDIDGLGKSLAIEGNVDSIFRDPNTTLGAGLNNAFRTSPAELKMQIQISNGTRVDSYTVGGDIIIQIGCKIEDATVEVLNDRIEFKENNNLKFTALFSQFNTIKDLVDFINSQTNWSAAVTSSRYQLLRPDTLDKGVFGATGLSAVKAARIKRDAAFFSEIVNQNGVVSVEMLQNSGLPESTPTFQFLTGGAKGGTTAAAAVAAIDAAEELDTNFIVPLFSQDAAQDMLEGETESSSTYTIEAINAYVKSHVIEMSQFKRRKNRIAICSKKGTYESVREAAGQLSSNRVALCFQDIRNISGDGTIKQYQPWMAAVIAAGMQSAAGFRGIVKKIANISGAIQAAGDFNSSNPGQQEDALKSGLLFLERIPTGGFRWVSDQMTYSIDANFVYNSLQANYVADLMTLTLINRFDNAVVGKSVAEISAAAAKAILESELFNFLRLKWIAPSTDAPKGYKDPSVKIQGGVMTISVNVKIAGLIYFVPISLTLSQVTQEA